MYFTIVGKELNTTSEVQYWSTTVARRYSFPSKNDVPEYKLYTLELREALKKGFFRNIS